MTAGGASPRLARGVRLRYDQVRDRWLLLAPERGFVLNRTALAIVRSLGDGPLIEIARRLASSEQAPEAEVCAFVEELAARGLVEESR